MVLRGDCQAYALTVEVSALLQRAFLPFGG